MRFAWSLGLKSLKQNLRRNIAAGCAIGIGYIAILSIMGYAIRIDRYLSTAAIYLQESGHIGVFKKGGLRGNRVKPRIYSLSRADSLAVTEFLEKDAAFEFAAPYLISDGLIGNGCKSFPYVAKGAVPAIQEKIFHHASVQEFIPEFHAMIRGKALWESAESGQVSLARGLAKKMGKGLKSEAPRSSRLLTTEDCASGSIEKLLQEDASVQLMSRAFDGGIAAIEADFTGEYSTGISLSEDYALQAPLGLMQEMMHTDQISYMAVFLKDRKQAARVTEDLRAAMAARGVDIDAYAYDDIRLNPNFVQGNAAMSFTVLFVSLIVVGVALLSILNTLSIGLAESRREIGTLLAIGYRPSQVASIFAVESLATAFIGLLLGAVGTYGICQGVDILAIPLKAPGFSHATTSRFTPTDLQYGLVGICLWLVAILTTFTLARRYASRPILSLLDRGG